MAVGSGPVHALKPDLDQRLSSLPLGWESEGFRAYKRFCRAVQTRGQNCCMHAILGVAHSTAQKTARHGQNAPTEAPGPSSLLHFGAGCS
jgi:hypothetical protein